MKGRHPSGRPIRKLNKRDYSMKAYRYTEFVCPRLNEKQRDTYAFGFVDHRVGDFGMEEMPPNECGRKEGKR